MKRRLLFIPLIVLAILLSQLVIIKPTAEAASTRAVNYCKQNAPKLGKSGQVDPTQLAACEAAYDNGYSDKSVAGVCNGLSGLPSDPSNASLDTFNGTAFAQCETFWLAGWQAAGRPYPTGFDGAGNKQSHPTQCQTYFLGDYLAACNSGSSNSKKTLAKACNPNVTVYAACYFGYAANGGNVTPPAPTPTPTGPTSPTSPTCDSGSFSLNWILCPIFNGVSDATDWILTSLIEPELKTQPICLDSSGSTCAGGAGKNYIFSAWSNFRVYGDIFLIVALLVIVFGESIGGGLIDAYTAKKVLPRLLAAAILINLSIYIVAALVDITNVVGGSIGEVVTAPLHGAGAFSITPGGIQQGAIAGAGIVGVALGGTALAALIATSEGFVFILIGLALPALLAFIGVFVTIILRQAIITFLILVSPVAFALYCLPNTERYFRKWWSTLFEMLIIYPVVVLIFAVSDILSVITGNLSSTNPINVILSFILIILPLFLIPFSFRIAGNTLSTIHGAVNGARQQINGMTKGLREQARQRYSDQVTQRQRDNYGRLNARGAALENRGVAGRIAGRGLKFAARAQTGFTYDIIAKSAAVQERLNKETALITGNEDDSEVRALTVDRAHAATRTGSDGQLQYQTISGYWVNATAVENAQRRNGNNAAAKQAALAYEMRKTVTEDGAQSIAANYAGLAQDWGLSDDQAGGAWIGAAFANQDKHLEFKRTNWQTGQITPDGASQFIDEMYENRGSYNVAQMNSNTVEQMKRIYEQTGDVDLRQKIAAISETFAHDIGVGGGGVTALAGPAGAEVPIIEPTAGAAPAPGDRPRQVNTPGAAHTAERVRELAEMTGVLRPGGPSGPYTSPAHDRNTPPPPPGSSVPPNQRRQN